MRWGREDEGLGQPDEDLAYHDQREGGRGTPGTSIPQPVTEEDQDGRGDDCEAGTACAQGDEG